MQFLVFACCDSRVSPSNILDFQPGEAFMFHNIANLVPPFNQLTWWPGTQLRYSGVGAANEYAVANWNVENILVIGHSRCGGIERLMSLLKDGLTANDCIDDWVQIGLSAKAKVKDEFGHLPPDKQNRECEMKGWRGALRGGDYDFVKGCFELWEVKSIITPPIHR
ncbi:CARBONIC ANHYDRASE [Salix purpurea]|uniref:Carbonic anhydrase n=1 Tax=Salix purpurea TaxID=77065 RepID=A0A9Q0W7M5_SALPP|nr:CARBONIC ANHYDRASE [Salix purpurea]